MALPPGLSSIYGKLDWHMAYLGGCQTRYQMVPSLKRTEGNIHTPLFLFRFFVLIVRWIIKYSGLFRDLWDLSFIFTFLLLHSNEILRVFEFTYINLLNDWKSLFSINWRFSHYISCLMLCWIVSIFCTIEINPIAIYTDLYLPYFIAFAPSYFLKSIWPSLFPSIRDPPSHQSLMEQWRVPWQSACLADLRSALMGMARRTEKKLKGAGSRVRATGQCCCVEACGWGESTTATELIFGEKKYRRSSWRS